MKEQHAFCFLFFLTTKIDDKIILLTIKISNNVFHWPSTVQDTGMISDGDGPPDERTTGLKIQDRWLSVEQLSFGLENITNTYRLQFSHF